MVTLHVGCVLVQLKHSENRYIVFYLLGTLFFHEKVSDRRKNLHTANTHIDQATGNLL